jgi:hypothetical protein
MKKLRPKSDLSSGNLIPFPGSKAGWLQRFESASPASRYQLLKDALDAPRLALDRETLAHAVATVGQILARHNHFDAQMALAAKLRQRSPEVYRMILPIQNLLELQEALFRSQPEQIPALIKSWLAEPKATPMAVLLMGMRFLIAYGQIDAALSLAKGLTGPSREVADLLRIDACQEGILRRQIDAQPIDWDAFRKTLAGLGLPASDIQACQHRLAASQGDVTLALYVACRQQDDSLYDWAKLAFGRWMLEQHGMSLLLSRDLISRAIALWSRSNQHPRLSEHIRFSRTQLQAYLDQPDSSPDFVLMDAFMLLWGLPLVYDWLVAKGLCSPRRRDLVTEHLAAVKPIFLEAVGAQIWSYRFVLDWPSDLDPETRAAEAESFRAARERPRPLGQRPEDSFSFDQPEIPDHVVDQLLALLAAQDIRGMQGLTALIDRLNPQQMMAIQKQLQALEAVPQARKPAQPTKQPVKHRAARYDYFLNPYSELGFTSCPHCEAKTRVRKFCLLVYCLGQLHSFNHSVKFCPACELLIIQRPAFEQLLRTSLPGVRVSKGQGYELMGTLDRKDWVKAEAGELDTREIEALHYPFRHRIYFYVVPPHYCFNESTCYLCLEAAAEMPDD